MPANSPSGRAIQRDNSQISTTDSNSSGRAFSAVAMTRSLNGCRVLATGRCATMLQPVLGTGA
ncbi:hypothetical protein D3C72_2185630 [compost metagenome]